jgi:ribosome biogenesis GTP-binding protein YlqF
MHAQLTSQSCLGASKALPITLPQALILSPFAVRQVSHAHRQRTLTTTHAVAPQHSSPRNRGKALLRGNLRPLEADDLLVSQITDELTATYNPNNPNAVEAVAMVQWYPGHIAKAERALKEQLKAVDIVLEVRDGRIPMSTRHPQIPSWIGSKPRVMVLNRRDMVSDAAAKAWTSFFNSRGHAVIWTNAHRGEGVQGLVQQALSVSESMNEKRLKRGLRPRPVRAVVVGFPNVGKSALINRLLGRRMADSAPRPGVTRVLRWMRIGGELDLLDAPGIIPMSFKDQLAAQRLAMCNDIGEASYVASAVAAALLSTMKKLPEGAGIMKKVEARYGVTFKGITEEEFVHKVGDRMFNNEPERAGQRILKDFRSLVFGKVCLEMPDFYINYKDV